MKLSKKLLIAILCLSSLLTLLGTAIQLYADYQRDLSHIQNEMKKLETIYKKPLAHSLWDFNYEQINCKYKAFQP